MIPVLTNKIGHARWLLHGFLSSIQEEVEESEDCDSLGQKSIPQARDLESSVLYPCTMGPPDREIMEVYKNWDGILLEN